MGGDHPVHPGPGDHRLHRRHRRDHLRRPVAGLLRPAGGRRREHFHEKLSALLAGAAAAAPADDGARPAQPAAWCCSRRALPGLRRGARAAGRAGAGHGRCRRSSTSPAWRPSAPPSAASRAACRNCRCPQLTLPRVLELLGPAFTIAMLGAIESLLSAVGRRRHGRHAPRLEPGTHRPGHRQHRRAAVRRLRRHRRDRAHGDQRPQRRQQPARRASSTRPRWCWSLLFLAPLAAIVPLAALAAILFVVAWNMSEVRHFAGMVRARRAPTSQSC